MNRRIRFTVLAALLAAAGSATCRSYADAADFVAVSAGGYHSCAMRSSGQVACWGYNDFGQLGDGTKQRSDTPTKVLGLDDAKAIAAGVFHTCAVRSSGQVVCWGNNLFGQLGDGTTTDRLLPTPVPGITDATSVFAGDSHTCALRSNGQVLCWGANGSGQLGDGSTSDSHLPTVVQGLTDAVSAAAGDAHSCAIRASGQTVCWGSNGFGQLGNGTLAASLIPTPVTGMTNAKTIDLGRGYSCAVRVSGQATCWGSNGGYGALGDGTITDRLVPTPVQGLADAQSIDAGYAHSCAVRATGQAVCWGDNENGELGDGTTTNRLAPTLISGITNFSMVSASLYYHSCGLVSSGEAYCWGMNTYGGLGDGTETDSPLPVRVRDGLPSPVSGVSVNLAPVNGKVKTKCRGEGRFSRLTEPAQVGVGCQIDTRKGTVSLTSAKAAKGTQTGQFRGGLFRVEQKPGRTGTDLKLTGRYKCSSTAPRHRPVRKLWGSGKGRFKTIGRGASAAVRGTIWLLADRCDGTSLVKVKRGVVTVRDFGRRKTVTVKAGGSYTTGRARR